MFTNGNNPLYTATKTGNSMWSAVTEETFNRAFWQRMVDDIRVLEVTILRGFVSSTLLAAIAIILE